MGAGLTLEGAQVAGGETMRDKIARRIAYIGHAPCFGDEVAAGVGGEGGGGVGEGAAGRIHSTTHHHPDELLDVALSIFSLEKEAEIIHERGVLLREGRVSLIDRECEVMRT